MGGDEWAPKVELAVGDCLWPEAVFGWQLEDWPGRKSGKIGQLLPEEKLHSGKSCIKLWQFSARSLH